MYMLFLKVLSESVSKALTLVGGEETSETAKFTSMLDKFYDALNLMLPISPMVNIRENHSKTPTVLQKILD